MEGWGSQAVQQERSLTEIFSAIPVPLIEQETSVALLWKGALVAKHLEIPSVDLAEPTELPLVQLAQVLVVLRGVVGPGARVLLHIGLCQRAQVLEPGPKQLQVLGHGLQLADEVIAET